MLFGCLNRALSWIKLGLGTTRWQTGEAPVGPELSQSPMRRYHPCWQQNDLWGQTVVTVRLDHIVGRTSGDGVTMAAHTGILLILAEA